MVYYNKDDMTNYSKGMGLNKVPVKNRMGNQNSQDRNRSTNGRRNDHSSFSPVRQMYHSENEILERQNEEGDLSGNESSFTIDEDGNRVRKRNRMGRGQIRHNDLETQSYNDDINGRVKVDSWNLNYKKKNKKKRPLDQRTLDRMNDIQNIYGVDARTLAGL